MTPLDRAATAICLVSRPMSMTSPAESGITAVRSAAGSATWAPWNASGRWPRNSPSWHKADATTPTLAPAPTPRSLFANVVMRQRASPLLGSSRVSSGSPRHRRARRRNDTPDRAGRSISVGTKTYVGWSPWRVGGLLEIPNRLENPMLRIVRHLALAILVAVAGLLFVPANAYA